MVTVESGHHYAPYIFQRRVAFRRVPCSSNARYRDRIEQIVQVVPPNLARFFRRLESTLQPSVLSDLALSINFTGSPREAHSDAHSAEKAN